jgi:hypothetical protein
MSDPTELVITATFSAAFGIFALTAVVRMLLGKTPQPHVVAPPLPIPLPEESGYRSPLTVEA